MKFFLCMHMDTSVVLMSTNTSRHMCIYAYLQNRVSLYCIIYWLLISSRKINITKINNIKHGKQPTMQEKCCSEFTTIT